MYRCCADHPIIVKLERDGELEPSEFVRACPECNADIGVGEWVYEINGVELCEQCFREWAWDYIETNPREVAEALTVGRRLHQ